jgi:hypothetical protein
VNISLVEFQGSEEVILRDVDDSGDVTLHGSTGEEQVDLVI